jgi:hypothetical protein
VDLVRIFERLQELERGLDDEDEDYMYKGLYKRFLRDPDKLLSPHKTLDKQITDLIMVLSRPDWIDFSNPKNHPVTRFMFDRSAANANYLKFFHQLVLSVELDLRINSRQHSDWAKEKLLPQIPPTIQWDLALARRWRENVRIDEFGRTPDQRRAPLFSTSLLNRILRPLFSWRCSRDFLTVCSSEIEIQAQKTPSQNAEAVCPNDEVAESRGDAGRSQTEGRQWQLG